MVRVKIREKRKGNRSDDVVEVVSDFVSIWMVGVVVVGVLVYKV